jgi:hypothetical protein
LRFARRAIPYTVRPLLLHCKSVGYPGISAQTAGLIEKKAANSFARGIVRLLIVHILLCATLLMFNGWYGLAVCAAAALCHV